MTRDSRGPRRSDLDWRPPGWRYLPGEGTERYWNALFYALCEVTVLGLPALLAVVIAAGPDRTLGAIVATLTATIGVALVRIGRTTLSENWPRFDSTGVLARIGCYNAAVALASVLGAAIDAFSYPGVGTVGFAALASIGAVAVLPALGSRIARALF